MKVNRRQFLGTSALAGTAMLGGLAGPSTTRAADAKPALLGGKPVRGGAFPGWPVFDAAEEQALLEVLRSGKWFRGYGDTVNRFEKAYAELTGARHCIASASGTAALLTALGAVDIGPGDEVLLPPYTFVATYNVVALNYALPVFVDVDRETFQMDPARVAAAITPQTRAILPVHIGGSPADLDRILELGKQRNLPVIEDACQAHLAEWRGRKVGTWGLAGCFSFQASKNLNAGEGGAVLTNDDQFAEVCYTFHNQGRARAVSGYNFTYAGTRGSNLRLTEFQAALLLAQMTRVSGQTRHRTENADYLTKLLAEIPGITPARLHDGATRSAYHLYMFRYDPAAFAGLPRGKFISALAKEGVPASSGYGVMNVDAYVSGLAKDRHYLAIYGERRMKDWLEQNRACPQNARLCAEAVWFTQNMLLGPRSDMDQIAEAIRKIQRSAGELARA